MLSRLLRDPAERLPRRVRLRLAATLLALLLIVACGLLLRPAMQQRLVDNQPPAEAQVAASQPATRAAAVTAATAIVVQLGGEALLDPQRRRAVLDETATAEAAAELEARLAAAATLLADRLGLTAATLDQPGVVLRGFPLGWQLTSWQPRRAEIAVWTLGLVIIDGRQATGPLWSTTTTAMVWRDGRWLADTLTTVTGPAPPPPGASGTVPLGETIDAFSLYDHAPRSE